MRQTPRSETDRPVRASMITPNPATNDHFKTGHHGEAETKVV